MPIAIAVPHPPKCPVAVGIAPDGTIKCLKCGQWACATCAKTNARAWASRARAQIATDTDHNYVFQTLTLRPTIKSASQAYDALPKLWDTWRKKQQRAIAKGDNYSYCAFIEIHPKRLLPHLHIIASHATLGGRVKDVAYACGFGFMATQSDIDGARAASYCSKYAGKSGAFLPRGFRRVRASQTWAKEEGAKNPLSLIVQQRNEFLSDFVVRIADHTQASLSDALDTALRANDALKIALNGQERKNVVLFADEPN